MSPTAPKTGPGTLTDAIYYASLPEAVGALHFGAKTGPFAGKPYAWLVSWGYYEITAAGILQYGPASIAAADALLTAAKLTGWPIDWYIMIENQSPEKTMEIRVNVQKLPYGPPYPSGQYDNPNISMPFQENNFPSVMPSGWIKFSTDAADFPAPVVPVKPPAPVVWTPVMAEQKAYTDPSTQKTHYYYGLSSGQNPVLNEPCTFQGLTFVAALYPPGDQSMMNVGGALKMWMLTGVAS